MLLTDRACRACGRGSGRLPLKVEGGDGVRSLLWVEVARRPWGVVVISGPPVETVEAVTLAAVCDITVVTVALRQVTDRQHTAAVAHLDQAGASPRGRRP